MWQVKWFLLVTLFGLTISAPQDPLEILTVDVAPGYHHRTHWRQSIHARAYRRNLPQSFSSASLSRKIGGSNRFATKSVVVNETTVNLFHETLRKVFLVSHKQSNHSWEWGTHSEALLEMYYNGLSVYSTTRKLPLSEEDGPIPKPDRLLDFIDPILARRDPNTLPIIDGDGASGDPASLGPAVLVAAAVTHDDDERSKRYKKLADDQLEWLLNRVPRSAEGAISQRDNEVQFWADFMYMVPPFLAYYGAASSNITILLAAYDQARLYRDKLQNSSREPKLWRHIIEGSSGQDELYWSTGNGWAAAGMMRVFSTFNNLRNATLLAQTEPWRKDLAEWVFEITNEVFSNQQGDSELIPNYMLTDDSKRNYSDCSGTALIASAAYRLASLLPSYADRLPMDRIEKSRLTVFDQCINSSNGVVTPVVDPLDWNADKPFDGASPEGQAFVVLLYQAWKAYESSLAGKDTN